MYGTVSVTHTKAAVNPDIALRVVRAVSAVGQMCCPCIVGGGAGAVCIFGST